MATIVTRASNDAPLTHEQMDQNLTNLNDQGVATDVRVDNIEQELNGKVDSVNNQTGAVELEASDIPFQPTSMLTANNVQAAVEEAQDKANARWLDSLPATMAGAADGYLLKVTGPPGSEQIVAVPGVSAGIPASAVRRYFDSAVEVINGVSYFQVTSTPPPPAAVPATAVNTVTTAGIFNLIAQFVSGAQNEQFSIQEGLWAFRMWLKASHANCTLTLQVSRLNTDTFVKTSFHTATWPIPDTSLQQFAFDFEQVTPITIEANERIVLEVLSYSPSAGRTITLTFDGVDRQTYVDVPVALLHNSLSGLQGGGGNERFHVSQAAAEAAENLAINPPMGYVTSEGVNSRGNYRAWSGGTLEQWGFRALVSALSNGASQAGSFDLPVSIPAGSTVRAVATACRANYAGPAFAVELRLFANPISSAMPSVFFNAYAGGGAAAGDGFYWYVWSK